MIGLPSSASRSLVAALGSKTEAFSWCSANALSYIIGSILLPAIIGKRYATRQDLFVEQRFEATAGQNPTQRHVQVDSFRVANDPDVL